jgi:23S rRNA pseudouridine1911/1915/1917 synthase
VVSTAADGAARRCQLSYRRLGEGPLPQSFLVEIVLHTGRYHQIRAQLAAIGCPILGDEKYQSTQPYRDHAIALHATGLRLLVGGQEQHFTAPPPWAEEAG